MDHQQTYAQNEAYAKFLSTWDTSFYAKYTDALLPQQSGARVLDVGCGVGQVMGRLAAAGFDPYGVDVCAPNIQRAKTVSPHCELYDGKTLPFANDFFASAGSFNVLEHVEEPELFISELVRVTKVGGPVVISSPNFFRVIGWRDYHPKMRGLSNKLANWKRLRQKAWQIKHEPQSVHFDHMKAIVKEPFTADDDAIIATNALEMAFFLEKYGCKVEKVCCTDRYVPKIAEVMLNLTPLRYLMFNAFVTARKVR